ncbi:acetyl/acyl transferase [Actinoallomurus sp. NBC_01490]|uniref:acyltransferase n=1 Tax=Actinoallomurus sp. NBC_01490 TaxID=2903557 RepID=UPI002E310216|nr:DapH/DapD/GlmU-related protein [Actinoallomurus sp. NBC_01490]
MIPRELFAEVIIGVGTMIGEQCTLGCPKEARLLERSAVQGEQVEIDERCLIFNRVVVYEGVHIGRDCVIEDRVRIGYDCRIGPGTRLAYGAYLCDRVVVGSEARVAGFICDGSIIGDRSTVMGELVHEYTQPHRDWWEVDEAPPVIEDDSVVGYGARVIGGVRVGPRSYVAAGAVVTRDVPAEHVVTGVNVQTPIARWSGRRLQGLIQHWRHR